MKYEESKKEHTEIDPTSAVVRSQISADITVPADGGWGWVVLFASFWSMFILTGNIFTFGPFLNQINRDFEVSETFSALINSVQIGTSFLLGPCSAALINRFGFRICAMMGSMLSFYGALSVYFSHHYSSVLITYGFVNGAGLSIMNMTSSLIIGCYFEEHRTIAITIIKVGANMGIMIMYPFYSYLLSFCDWRYVVMFQAGMYGIIYFLSLTYRPLLTFTAYTLDPEGEPAYTVTILPNVHVHKSTAQPPSHTEIHANRVERFVGAVSNTKFPTAAAVVSLTPGTSDTERMYVILKPNLSGILSYKQLKRIEAKIAKQTIRHVEMIVDLPPQQRVSISLTLTRCFQLWTWRSEPDDYRPLYRDDAFYFGAMNHLYAYQKYMQIPPNERCGLEYQLTLTRAVPIDEQFNKQTLCTKPLKRVLTSMLDFSMLSKYHSFIFYCISALLSYIGIFVPYMFLTNRNKANGLDNDYFVSVIALSTAISRLFIILLTRWISSTRLYCFFLVIGGVSTFFSDRLFTSWYQYSYCAVFGCSVSAIFALPCMSLVDLYGLTKLTNATGILCIFMGIGSLISAPLGALLIRNYGYRIAFCFAGVVLSLGGLLLLFHKPINVEYN